LQAYAGYRFSKLFQLTAGYGIIGIDYDKGVDKERFIFNMNEFGPVIRIGFNF
jgi:trans-2-enoyl-CoA reductase